MLIFGHQRDRSPQRRRETVFEPNGVKPVTSNLKLLLMTIGVAAGLTALLYGNALALPFFSDDLLQVMWVKATHLPEFWRAVGPYRDYRPLHFTIWRLVYLLLGDLRPAALHALNLTGHALCGVLVGWLASRDSQNPHRVAPLATAIFVAFPFSFDAVPWAIAFSYPLAVALALGALLTYLRARERPSLPLHLLAVTLTGLCGFAYEGGVVAGVLTLLAEVTLHPDRRRFSLWPLAHLAASLLPLVAGVLARPPAAALPSLSWSDLPRNAALALQALTFPTMPLAELLAEAGLTPTLAVAAVGLPTLAAVWWATRHSATGSRPHTPMWAVGWWAVWCLPPLLTLRFDWLTDAPRVFYPAAVGVAVLWTVAAGTQRSAVCRARQGTTGRAPIVAALCLLPAGMFILTRLALERQVGNLLWETVRAADTGPLLVVNLPSRITPPTRIYPLGHEGVIPLPPRVGAEDLVAAHTGRPDAAFERAWGPVLPPLPYAVQPLGDPLAPADLRSANRVALVVYRADGMSLADAGAVGPPTAPVEMGVARFGSTLHLLALSCQRASASQVVLITRWQATAPLTGTPTVFVHLLDDDGRLLAQADGDPLRGLYPLPQWLPGEVVEDVRTLTAPPGPSTVALGVWDPFAGTRWEAIAADGARLPDEAVRCVVGDQEWVVGPLSYGPGQE
jgi:hypothetical protein